MKKIKLKYKRITAVLVHLHFLILMWFWEPLTLLIGFCSLPVLPHACNIHVPF